MRPYWLNDDGDYTSVPCTPIEFWIRVALVTGILVWLVR